MPAQPGEGERRGRLAILLHRVKSFSRGLIAEGLDPLHLYAAVFIGVFFGVVPIYGFQSLAAIGLAAAFKLNKPLTFGATFINNPLMQPFLILFSIELGHYMLHGELLQMSSFHIRELDIKSQLSAWLLGSIVLGALLGTVVASIAVLIARPRSGHRAEVRESARFVRGLFQASPRFARGFVKWKMRLDKIFDLLLLEDLGQGSAVDLGCGYGIALAVTAFRNPERRLIGCDIDRNRIGVAGQALKTLKASLAVDDVRTFEFQTPGLILILDVLQYLDSEEQRTLLKRCCAVLEPGGKLIFRVPDTERRTFSKLTRALDGLIFRSTGRQNRPVVLGAAEYEKVLQDGGVKIRKQHLVNRLPLAHVLFTAEKPAKGESSVPSEPVSVSTRAVQ